MGIKIETSTTEMRTKSDDVRREGQQFKNLADEMFNEGRELDKTWEGDASDSFENRLKADEPRFGELFNVINQWCDAINESAADYDKTEDTISQEMRGNTKRQSS